MQASIEEVPISLLLESLAATPYLVKAALAEARDGERSSLVAADLNEVEAGLSLLKVPGWREGEGTTRPPYVRRNLLLLLFHLHRERLGAITVADDARQQSDEVVAKCRRLLDVFFTYAMQCGWIKVSLAITELQALLLNGLWDHHDDDCHSLMKTKLQAVGLKMPRITVRGKCGDVRPGEKVTLKVDVSRAHAFSAEELAAYRTLQAEGVGAEAEVRNEGDADAEGSAAETTEGWWLFVESIRGLPQLNKAGMQNTEQQHNQLVARVALAPSLDAVGCSSELQFVAPSTAGEYKVIVHVRSCSMIGVDARRKVSFVVRGTKRPAPPSSSSGTSTEPCETMEAMEEAIAELQAEILEEEEGEAAAGKQRPEKAPEDAPVVAAAVEAEVA